MLGFLPQIVQNIDLYGTVSRAYLWYPGCSCVSEEESANMLGWMILFALMILPGAAATVAGYPAAVSLKTTSVVFAALLLIALMTRMVRGRAR
jgi:hypothetical protein